LLTEGINELVSIRQIIIIIIIIIKNVKIIVT